VDRDGMEFEPWEGSFVVRRWDRSDPETLRYTQAAVLEPKAVAARVEVRSGDGPVAGAKVAVAGKTLGRTDDDGQFSIDLGRRTSRSAKMSVKAKGFKAWSEQVALKGGETLIVELDQPGAPSSKGRATAAYESLGRVVRVRGADVQLGRRKLGQTDDKGRVRFTAASEKAKLTIRKDGFLPDPAQRTLSAGRGGTFVLTLYPSEAPTYRVAVLPPKNGSPGNADVETVLPQLEDKLSDYLFSYGVFERVDATAFSDARRAAARSGERILDGWAGTPLADLADAVVYTEAALDDELVLSVQVVSVGGKRLGAFAETQRIERVRHITEQAAEKILQVFPLEGHVTHIQGNKLNTSLGSGKDRDVSKGNRIEVYRWSGSVPPRLKLRGRGKIHRVSAYSSTVLLDSGVGDVAEGDKVVLLPRAKEAAFASALELTLVAGAGGAQVPVADVNVYRDGAWVGTTSGEGRLRVPVGSQTDHDLLFVKSGIQPHKQEIRTGRGVSKETVVMPHTMTTLRIDSEPSGGRVTVDGRELGTTPLEAPLARGFRRVRIEVGGEWRAFDQVLELTRLEEDYTGARRIVLEKDVLTEAERLLATDQVAEAVAVLSSVERAHPDYSAARNLLGGVYLDTSNDPDQAIEAFESVLALPENKELVNKRFTVTFLNLGRAYYATGTPEGYQRAIENLRTARDNRRFFPKDRYDIASHDTLYFLALASHKLYHAESGEQLLRETSKRWKDYLDFFPASLAGDEQAGRAREGAEQFHEEILHELGE